MGRKEKIQGNPWYKALAIVVLLAAAFGAGIFGARVLLALPYRLTDSWQDTADFDYILTEYRDQLVSGVAASRRLEEVERDKDDSSAAGWTYADLEDLERQLKDLEQMMEPSNTWFRYSLRAADGEELATNRTGDRPLADQVKQARRFTFRAGEISYGEVYYRDGMYYVTESWDLAQDEAWASFPDGIEQLDPADEVPAAPAEKPQILVLEYGVPEEVTDAIQDGFYTARRQWGDQRANFDVNLTGALQLLALTLLALACLLWAAGHKSGVEGAHATWQEKIWLELYAAVMITAGVGLAACALALGHELYDLSYYHQYILRTDDQLYENLALAGLGAICACEVGLAALLLRTFAARLKTGSLARTTLLCRVATWTVRTVHDFLRFLPFTWKAVLGFLIYCVLSCMLAMAGYSDGAFMMMYCFLQLAALLFLGWWVYGYHLLRQGTKTIARGNLEYQIDTKRMPYDLKLQAEDLNNISAGLSSAVDEKMRSERFKAELITNVSHDLKTPLTSIINYVGLLKSTQQTDPKAQEYIEVLDRKSQRLKKLTEDLVEASKASTGVLAVTREKIGMAQLIDQALGEWTEKLNDRKLSLVTNLPEGETWVYADGRHLWRVIDNLLSNCAKYAMEGTRVYLDLARGKGQVMMSVKNISREPLNVPPERLMERFVRGDESRTTEGSGLGLSIARSLTELQGGTFELAVDGDLFKATVTLPQAN